MTGNYFYEYRIRRVRRSLASEPSPGLDGPGSAATAFRALCAGESREVFMVALLDSLNRVLGVEIAAVGSGAHVDVHPREVFRAAILAHAAAIVVAHNHPSGVLEPSVADLELTTRLREAGELLGIPVLDHLIVNDDHHFSLADSQYWRSLR